MILHLNNEKTWRGGERQTLLLAAALPARGMQSTIACRHDGFLAHEAQLQGVPTLPVAAGNLGLGRDLRRYSSKFTLVHCHTGRGHSVAAINTLLSATPIIVTRRVDFLPRQSWFNRFKYRRAKKVVCISQFIAGQLRDWGVAQEKLVVIPSAVPLRSGSTKTDGKNLRDSLPIAADKRIIGNIAALVGHKDHATLLRAAREVVNRRRDVAFVIIGEGALRKNLERLRGELQLERDVHLAGFVPNAERLLPAFDVFAMSSAMEGLGSIVLDAFAAGVPVVSTAAGGLPELVKHGQTGLLAPVGDFKKLAGAILRMLDASSLAAELAANARKSVQANFSVDGMADRYLQVYREVLANCA